jgi:4-amino-4-deoxy-L-arabinose transferase-like glycosyltransferase
LSNKRWKLGSGPFPALTSSLSILILTIALAFGLRLVGLNNLPRSRSLDEAVDGLDALQLSRLAWFTPFLQNYFGRETLFFYLQGLALVGYGPSIFSLRFASVVAGTLTIPLVYLVGYRLTLTNPPPPDSKKEFRLRPSAVAPCCDTSI